MHTGLLLFFVSYGNIKDIGIKAQWRAKNFGLIIKSYLFEGIFVDAKVMICASLKIVQQKIMPRFLIDSQQIIQT